MAGRSSRLPIEYPDTSRPIDTAAAGTARADADRDSRHRRRRSRTPSSLPIVRVGRSPAPHDDRGRARRNDVAFLENGDDDNKTVTRGHCEIRYSRANGGYRIFDERSANGTRIVRDGEIIDVPANDPIGVAILDGDELQFGNAAVRVAIGGPPRT